MFVKRFIAKDMQEAMKKIRKDFGPDAVILDSKTVRNKGIGGLLQKKVVEVVAAYDFGEKKFGSIQPAKKEPVKNESKKEAADKKEKAEDTKIEMLSEQLDALKDAVADFSNKIRIANKETTLTFSPGILKLYNGLLQSDVQEDMAKEIAAQTQEIIGKKKIEANTVARQLVLDKLGEPSPLRLKKYKQNVLLFTGPTGVGKTTTLVKLAAMLAFEKKQSVGLINMDTYRVGAIEHIRIYSEIMDIPVQTAYNTDELKSALKALEDKDVVLIDTAGKSPGDKAYKKELAGYIKICGADEIFLVLSIVTGYKACRDIIDYYSFIQDYKLIVTKLDEAGAWGNIVNMADCTKMPLSYVTMGQDVPEDICEADMNKLVRNIVGRGVLE
ncbi:MAG: flagellar biosynthesis protein FlhF [Eubacteriales bacterium]|nr:flagellar biosynthesis protein FlhF [Eubacteriales bacterium]